MDRTVGLLIVIIILQFFNVFLVASLIYVFLTFRRKQKETMGDRHYCEFIGTKKAKRIMDKDMKEINASTAHLTPAVDEEDKTYSELELSTSGTTVVVAEDDTYLEPKKHTAVDAEDGVVVAEDDTYLEPKKHAAVDAEDDTYLEPKEHAAVDGEGYKTKRHYENSPMKI
ncbi:uncharacterized protein LOC143037260 [Oratosquilla oratoria]|uniref:uncharacterized protein LOC143037260 n=1 Tax=Oratosquilla oratoria TaxID=337810 RepID=UPI003F7776D2